MNYEFQALNSALCRDWRDGSMDANGQSPERAVSDGGGNPCRHCLLDIAANKAMLILAHRPFAHLNPYAEVGPIFICTECQRHADSPELPPIIATRSRHLLKGYLKSDRIAYGTGAIVETDNIPSYLEKTFTDPNVAYVDVRSATNNCFTVRIARQIH